MKIVDTEEDGAMCEDQHGRQQRRHADDIKIVDIPESTLQQHHSNTTVQITNSNEGQTSNDAQYNGHQEETNTQDDPPNDGPELEVSKEVQQTSSAVSSERRYPLRDRRPNPKYSNGVQ